LTGAIGVICMGSIRGKGAGCSLAANTPPTWAAQQPAMIVRAAIVRIGDS
jgi:hypothetical protein